MVEKSEDPVFEDDTRFDFKELAVKYTNLKEL